MLGSCDSPPFLASRFRASSTVSEYFEHTSRKTRSTWRWDCADQCDATEHAYFPTARIAWSEPVHFAPLGRLSGFLSLWEWFVSILGTEDLAPDMVAPTFPNVYHWRSFWTFHSHDTSQPLWEILMIMLLRRSPKSYLDRPLRVVRVVKVLDKD